MAVVSNWLAATASAETHFDPVPLYSMPTGSRDAVFSEIVRNAKCTESVLSLNLNYWGLKGRFPDIGLGSAAVG